MSYSRSNHAEQGTASEYCTFAVAGAHIYCTCIAPDWVYNMHDI